MISIFEISRKILDLIFGTFVCVFTILNRLVLVRYLFHSLKALASLGRRAGGLDNIDLMTQSAYVEYSLGVNPRSGPGAIFLLLLCAPWSVRGREPSWVSGQANLGYQRAGRGQYRAGAVDRGRGTGGWADTQTMRGFLCQEHLINTLTVVQVRFV